MTRGGGGGLGPEKVRPELITQEVLDDLGCVDGGPVLLKDKGMVSSHLAHPQNHIAKTSMYSADVALVPLGNQYDGMISPVEATMPSIMTLAGCLVIGTIRSSKSGSLKLTNWGPGVGKRVAQLIAGHGGAPARSWGVIVDPAVVVLVHQAPHFGHCSLRHPSQLANLFC